MVPLLPTMASGTNARAPLPYPVTLIRRRAPESSPAFFSENAVADASVTRTAEEMDVAAKPEKSKVAGSGDPLHGTPLFSEDCRRPGAEMATTTGVVVSSRTPTPCTVAETTEGAEPFDKDATAARIPVMVMVAGIAPAGTV